MYLRYRQLHPDLNASINISITWPNDNVGFKKIKIMLLDIVFQNTVYKTAIVLNTKKNSSFFQTW